MREIQAAVSGPSAAASEGASRIRVSSVETGTFIFHSSLRVSVSAVHRAEFHSVVLIQIHFDPPLNS